MNYLAMTGQGNNQIDSKGVLRLDVEDGYYDLIEKTQTLFDWFLLERSEPWLVKCDDDVWLSPAALDRIVSNPYLYAGAYGHVYAGGPLYLLHRKAIEKLGPLQDYAGQDKAEDVTVGKAAKAAGVKLFDLGLNHVQWYNHLQDDLVGPHSWDMAFSHHRDNHQALMSYCEANYDSQGS